MGSSEADALALPNEKPQHTVYVGEFQISRTEVTNAQYIKCVNAGVCPAPKNETYNRTEFTHRPVTDVSWYDATTYAGWVGGRLPTEAEWEKACRGTDVRIYPWGNAAPTGELLNYDRPIAGSIRNAGSYPKGKSPYGVLDMAGNVWEWISSEERGYPYVDNDGREGSYGGRRVLRGGAYYDVAANVRCAVRISNLPDDRYQGFGFRVVMSAAK